MQCGSAPCAGGRIWLARRDLASFRYIVRIFRERSSDKLTILDLYIIGSILVGSIICVATGLPYIDALFFAAGAATQSGLNS